ncbi:hypothetical protein TKK_0014473 [Trichogramma kaykai]|uniref:Rap-GAP domain-containing protein n=1 Tax=Trichogramma kaykai TaxID=54128 RepID=A0ABD2WDF3_9HYME
MFSKKLHVDLKKSTLKIQDPRKDSATRFKHLKIVLDNLDTEDAKGFFEANFSHVYFILFDVFSSAETNLRQRELSFHLVHKAHREELEQALQLLEKVLTLLPELLNRRWQVHSLGTILQRLLHPKNSYKLRRQAIRYFILWYQALGENAPEHIHQLFTCLVPGFPPCSASPLRFERRAESVSSSSSTSNNSAGKKHTKSASYGDDKSSREFYDSNLNFGMPVINDDSTNAPEIVPILPPQSGEKPLENECVKFFESLLEYMVTQVVKIEWRDKHNRQYKSFQFILERFKATYLRYICPEFDDNFSLYKPNLEIPSMRKQSNLSQSDLVQCKVVLIKWIANFTHIAKKDGIFSHLTQSDDSDELRRVSMTHSSLDSSLASADQSTHESAFHEDSTLAAMALVRDVLYGSRENVNFIHEMYRQAFLLDFTHATAIRKAIGAYKDWIQMNDVPPFMLEPLDGHRDRDYDELQKRDRSDSDPKSPQQDSNQRLSRLRNDSYIGAIQKDGLFVRAGLQNVLLVFITQASNVFFLETTVSGPASAALLEEQTDSCKRVLNVYRYVVMHTRLEPQTWEQLLRVLLQITSQVLGERNSRRSRQQYDTIGSKLAPAIFQTLIVTWIKANLNVIISTQLWDQFLQVLTSLTHWEELIREWAKTLDTLTRVLARHVYNLDLNDLPLDRLSEQKSKKRRGVGGRAASTGSVQPQLRRGSTDQETAQSSKEVTDHGFRESRKVRPLSRSASDNSIYNGKIRAKMTHTRQRSSQYSNNTVVVVPALPLSIERDMARLAATTTTTTNHHHQHQNGIQGSNNRSAKTRRAAMAMSRRAKSLESVVTTDSEPPSPRCPSPTPSSGVDSNKDSPIQIDNIDGSSIDTNDQSEKRSVMAGGGVRGWLPDVAVVLWRRMLSALGDVNNIQDPVLHGQVMEYLVQLTLTLVKIRLNQGVSGDNQATPPTPDLIPPLTIIAPWCFKAIQLPQQFETGKLAAYRLICLLTMQPQDIRLPKQHLTLFYRAVHHGISSNDPKILHTIVKYTGPRLFSLHLPGSSLLILDYIQAANIILSSQDINSPRAEAVSILGSLLSLPTTNATTRVLQPNEADIVTTTCPYAKDHIIAILMRCCRREPTGVARCVALSSIAMFVYKELCHRSLHRTVPEAFNVLLLSLKTSHATVAQVACDCLLLLCDKADVLLEQYADVPAKIIQCLSENLERTIVQEKKSTLTISMLFCLGEWAMHLGPSLLLRSYKGKPLLLTLFTVLDNIVQGRFSKDPAEASRAAQQDKQGEDFDPSIALDNLLDSAASKAAWRGGSGNAQSVQLAAKMIMMHLVNHLGHFPMGIGAARLSSLVVELDDVPNIEGDELSSSIFNAPNIQLLMLSNSIIMSLVELDTLDVPGGGVTAGLTTAPSMVRVLLRDLAGKASWDSSILYSQPTNDVTAPQIKFKPALTSYKDDMCSVMPVQSCPPRHTMRHHDPNVLPTFENGATDMDNLDDLLQYIGHTSPEVLTNPESTLNSAAQPPQGQSLESETIATILSQRNIEREHTTTWSDHASIKAAPMQPPSCRPPPTPFHHCRLLFSHLGLAGWEQRRKLHLLAKNEKLLRELRNLDGQRSRETHKMAVIYVAPGQEDKMSVLSNVSASKEYESFIARLAWEVELESHTGFLGGLVPGKASGVTAPYFATSFAEVIFHVATRMPSDSPESLLQKTRHLGNDEIHIVWSEHWRDYRRDIIPTEFCDVLIVIYPLPNKLYRVQVSRKPEIPYFGLLFDECIVEDSVLPGLVRTTALAASRAKRTTLTLYQHYYEERARSIDTITRNHKEATTFEEFAANVYSPVQPPSLFGGASSISGSTTSIQSAASTNLAAALIDSHQSRPNLRGTSAANNDNRANRVSDGGRVWFSSDTTDSSTLHGISPRPAKKMSFKSGPRNKNNVQPTPPDSPRYK